MKQIGERKPVAAYSLPPHQPEAIEAAYALFNDVAEQWARVRGEIDDAEEEAARAEAGEHRAAVDALAGGKAPSKGASKADQIREKTLPELRRRESVLSTAVDELGNTLASVIAEHRDEWRKLLAEAADEAAGRFDAAVSAAQAAFREYEPAASASAWLEEFSASEASIGRSPQFSGGRVRVRDRTPGSTTRGEHDPRDLLALAARATTPEPKPEPRKGTLAESVFVGAAES